MSFSIFAIGSKEEVKRQLADSKGYGDTAQHDGLRDLLATIVENAPPNMSFSVQAGGHHDYASQTLGSLNMTLTLLGKTKTILPATLSPMPPAIVVTPGDEKHALQAETCEHDILLSTECPACQQKRNG